MFASLPMYLRESNRAAHDRFWALIRDGLLARAIPAPTTLNHDINHMDGWGRDDLVLGQICNLPLRGPFHGKVTAIGAADYGLQGCDAGHYRSLFVVHKDCAATDPKQMANARFAYNEPLSQSGYGAPQLWAQAKGFLFTTTHQTGAHAASIAAVANGTADIAAIDAHTWWIEQGENPDTTHLKVIGTTAQSPGMTFITRLGQDPAPYFAAIQSAISRLSHGDRETLRLKAIVALPQNAYALPFPPKHAALAD